MTINITLGNLANLTNENTAVSTINANSALITTAFSSALATSGDKMLGTLDMNSNQIINLPAPATANSPARLVDITSSTGSFGLLTATAGTNISVSSTSTAVTISTITSPTFTGVSTTNFVISGTAPTVTVAGQPITLNGSTGLIRSYTTPSASVAVTTTAADIISLTMGTTGTFLVNSNVTFTANTANSTLVYRVWDGTTTFLAGQGIPGSAQSITYALSGLVTNPASTIRLSVALATTAGTGGTFVVLNNGEWASTGATNLSAVRIA